MELMTVVAVKEQIAERLRSEIISGALAPNQKLTEEELAQRFGVSRGRIRDVLLELSKEGLLVSRANRGTTVNDVAPPELQSLLIKMRLSMETFAIKAALDSPIDDLLGGLDQAFQELKRHLKAGDFAEVTKADIAFHRTIVAAGGGENLVNLWQPVIMRMRMNYKRISSPDDSIREHEAIIAAIKSGDARRAIEALKANIR